MVTPRSSIWPGETGRIARAARHRPGRVGQNDRNGAAVDTRHGARDDRYMSPEQASGRVHQIDQRSDIFSFGCLLFEATTGQMAFEGEDALDSLHRIVYGRRRR